MVRIRVGLGALAQLAVLAMLDVTLGLGAAGWLVGTGVGLVTAATLTKALERSGAATVGPANGATLARAAIVGGVAALVAESFAGSAPLAALTAMAAVALVLDGVDGHIARRTGDVTAVGARFDMEVDAFLLLALSVFVARTAGPWVLLIGVARYVFVAAGWVLPWLREPTPPRHWCKTVAAVQGIALTIAIPGIFPRPAVDVLLVAALVLLAESFGRQVWLLSRRPVRTYLPVRAMETVTAGR